jgi:hypothetical protein
MSKRTILFFIPLSLSLIGLGGCGVMDEPSARNGGGYIVPPAPIAPAQPNASVLDGYGNPAPELNQWNASEETREWHGAVSRADCDRIEKALKAKGLDIYLSERKPTGDPNFPWACIFEGNDADPNAARFQDRRYENRDEAEYP